MNTCVKYFEYIKELFKLSSPIIMGNIGFIIILSTNVFVAAKYSTDVLAAVSIAVAFTSFVFMFGMGLLASISPVLSNKLGNRESIKTYFKLTIKFAMTLAIITTIGMLCIIPLIDFLGFEEKLVPNIKLFIAIVSFSTFGAYLHVCLKEFLQAYEIVFFPNLITVIAIVINFLLNWTLVFDYGLGVAGLGIANVLIRLFMGLTILAYCLIKFNFKTTTPYKTVEKDYYGLLLKVGLPISFAVTIEFLAFNGISIIMGRVEGIFAAAQNIITTLTSISFMIPLAISNAIAIKTGYANGAKNLTDLKRYSIAGIFASVAVMAVFAVIYGIFPKQCANLFTNDEKLISIIVPILIVVALFQVFDGLQVSLAGIFKGIKQTKIVVVSNFIGYILIALGVGSIVAFKIKLALFGYWIGLFFASITICMILSTTLIYKFKKVIREGRTSFEKS